MNELDDACDLVLDAACKQAIAAFRNVGYGPGRQAAYWTLLHALAAVVSIRVEAGAA